MARFWTSGQFSSFLVIIQSPLVNFLSLLINLRSVTGHVTVTFDHFINFSSLSVIFGIFLVSICAPFLINLGYCTSVSCHLWFFFRSLTIMFGSLSVKFRPIPRQAPVIFGRVAVTYGHFFWPFHLYFVDFPALCSLPGSSLLYPFIYGQLPVTSDHIL